MKPIEAYKVEQDMTTTSLKLAEYYERRHDNVLQTIDRYITDLGDEIGENCSLWFQVCFENNELQNGKPLRYFTLTEEAALIIVGRMHGKRAALRQIKIAQAFTAMKRTIQHHQLQAVASERAQLENARVLLQQIKDEDECKANTLAKLFDVAPSKTRSMFRHLEALGIVESSEKTIHGHMYHPTSAGADYVDHIDKNGTVHWKPTIMKLFTTGVEQ